MLFVHVVRLIRGPADPEKKSDAGRYTKSDVLFAACHITLIYSYMGCGIYAGWTHRMVGGAPLYEFYFLAICEVLWTSCLNAMLTKTGRVGALNVLEAMLPFGERFDLLRDATAVADYVCIATAWSYAGLAVVLSTNILGTMLIFWRRDDLRQLRSAVWPTMASPAQEAPTASSRPNEAEDRNESSGLLVRESAKELGSNCCSRVEKLCFVQLGNGTSHAKQMASLCQQLPQALASTVVLVAEDRISPVMLFCASTAWFQLLMIEVLRPHVLSLLAKRGIPWRNVCPRDFARARLCSSWDATSGRWALRLVALDEGLPRNDREAAARALGEEFLQATQTGDAQMQTCLKRDQGEVFAGLVKQNQADVLNAFAASSAFVAEDEELTVAPAKAHNWSMVSVLVNSTQRANVNFCQLTEGAFKAELMPQLHAQLPRLEYLNLNDNPKLCETQEGLRELKALMAKAPNLQRLRLQRSVVSEELLTELRAEWSRLHPGGDGLEIELPKPK